MLADAVEVTRRLRIRLGIDRVVLVGSSYGSILGLRLARAHPELYSAYVGTDQNIHDAGRDTSTHQAFLERLRAAGKHRQGAQDILTPPERAKCFFDDVRAPVKGASP